MLSYSKRKKILHCNLMQAVIPTIGSDGVLVIHNPRSCSHIPWDAYHKLGIRYSNITGRSFGDAEQFLYCTGLTNQDAVFGGDSKLFECLMDIGLYRKPSFILVACGCIPGMTGDNTESICREVEEKIQIPIILLPGHGFMVPQMIDTIISASRLLFERFTSPYIDKVEKDRRTVVVFGVNPAYVMKESYQDFLELLRALGFTKIYTYPIGMTKKDYENAASAAAVISWDRGVLKKEWVMSLANEISDEMKVPHLHLRDFYPVEDIRYLYRLAKELLGSELDIEDAYKKKELHFISKIKEAKHFLCSKRCIIYVGLGSKFTLIQYMKQFLETMGLTIQGIGLSPRMPEQARAEYEAYFSQKEVNVPCFLEGIDRYESDLELTTIPFNLDHTNRIILPECIGFRGYEQFLCSMVEKVRNK